MSLMKNLVSWYLLVKTMHTQHLIWQHRINWNTAHLLVSYLFVAWACACMAASQPFAPDSSAILFVFLFGEITDESIFCNFIFIITCVSMSCGRVLSSPQNYRVTNIVCKGKFDLSPRVEIRLSEYAHLGSYNPNRFSALIIKTSHDKSKNITCLLFRNGKINVLGLREEGDIPWAANYFADLLNINSIPNLQICTISACYKLHCATVPLYKFALALKGCSYEPELIPCVIFKRYGLTFCIFSGSTVVVTGGSSIYMIKEGCKKAFLKFQDTLLCL